MMTDAGDEVKCVGELQQQHDMVATTTDDEVAVTTDATDKDKYTVANELMQEVDVNIVKTATLRKQMPVKCAQLLARRCRFQLSSIVSMPLL